MAKRKRKLKKSVVYLFLLVVVLIAMVVCYFMFIANLEIKFNNNVFNINDNVYNYDLILEIKNGEIITEKKLIDTASLGKKEEKLSIKDKFNNKKEYNIEYNIIDNMKPVISYNKELKTKKGVKIDLLKDVEVTDNSKEELEVKIEGDYDFDKVGEYTLYYVAKDSSNNEVKEEFKLIVEENTSNNDNKKKEENKKQEDSKPSNTESTTSKGFKVVVKNGITYVDGYLIANKTYSLPSTYNPGGLTSETLSAANEMIAAAKKEGLSLYVASGFRSYDTQKNMWTRRKNQYGQAFADAGTARPGHSEHQTGLGFDMCGAGNGCITEDYHNSTGAKWMSKNAYKFGLILRYPKDKTNETGYIYESWHFRYVGKDLAEKLYNNGDWITMESYFGITSEYNY